MRTSLLLLHTAALLSLSLSLAAPARAQGAAPPSEPAPPAAPAPPAPVPPAAPPPDAGAAAAPAQPGGAPIAPVAPASPADGAAIAPIAPASPADGAAIAPAGTGRELVYLVPAEVTGTSGGAALARVGFGVLAGFGEVTDPTAWDVSTVLEAEVATKNGLATLIGLSSADEAAQAPIGSLRLSASFARLDFEGAGSSAYPPLILYVGGAVGRTRFNYLGPGPGRRDTSLPPTYAPRELIAVPWSAGAAAVYVGEGGKKLAPTIEGQIAFDSRWTASTDTLEWCEPAGDVVAGVDPVTQSTTFASASRCKREVLGAPRQSQELTITAHAGIVDKVASATFRAAFGARVAVALNDDAPDDVRISLRAPVYVTLARAPEGTKYRGLIRLMPALSIDRRSTGETDVGGMLEISFLGQRAMFSDNYTDL
ncbi:MULTISPECIES: hypothetical protein [Sorangium]|uniref:Secreted protein n=1 Tax=Sorangium cellulosum TaxID=56 RepID=A0A4P2R2D7_SORCE|nr:MULTISPECIES: hypothetical protein [Sorangium]AUX37139.1 uncharacterized protein SOCE836_093600 [Sorangium cellulosum]WCQ96429.1 hypothetical protein NQZ70_09215 [Sorangium sp. Soce836]